jgi:hypothetical protein
MVMPAVGLIERLVWAEVILILKECHHYFDIIRIFAEPSTFTRTFYHFKKIKYQIIKDYINKRKVKCKNIELFNHPCN